MARPIGRVREVRFRDCNSGDGRRSDGFSAWNAMPRDARAAALERAGDLIEAQRGQLIALLQARGRQDPGRLRVRSARGGRLLPLLRRAGAHCTDAASRCRARPARATSSLSRPRRVRLHQPVEFPARDLHRPGRGGACRRQFGGRQACGADASDREPPPFTPARGRRSGQRAASRSWRRRDRRAAG